MRADADQSLRPLRVAIDARITAGQVGGVEQVVIGLAYGLSQLTDGPEKFVFVTYEGRDAWLREHIHGPCKLLELPYPPSRTVRDLISRFAPGLAAAAKVARHQWRRMSDSQPAVATSHDLGVEGADLVHFPFQNGSLTDLPSIYHPHDLQHLHLPHFFTSEQFQQREFVYRALCSGSTMVAVASQWVRADVIAAYGLPEEKVFVVPLAPPVDAFRPPTVAEVSTTRSRYQLPAEFVLYPAATWPHKNHIRLLEALALLKSRGVRVPLVCTGMQTGHFRNVNQRIEQFDLTDQVQFLGVVPAGELVAIYAAATAVVIPTEFEAASFPVWEAFRAGVPVACSNVTSLPEQVGDAAVLFDPQDVAGMATSIESLWADAVLRRMLVERGRVQVARFDWLTTASLFRAHYRRIAGRLLNENDLSLLNAPPAL